MEFITMDIKTIIHLATYKKLINDDLRTVRAELIAYLSSNKRNSYYNFILKLASESVLSICKDRDEFIEFLLKYGIRKTFLAYAKEQFVYMDIAEDFLKEVTKSLIRISKDLSFFEMISIFFAVGPYKIEFLKGIKGKLCNKDFKYTLIQVITKCYHDKYREIKILKEKLTYNDLYELYNLLLETSDDIQSYKELLEMSYGKLEEEIQSSILLLDIKGA
jgi:hypothetical protein